MLFHRSWQSNQGKMLVSGSFHALYLLSNHVFVCLSTSCFANDTPAGFASSFSVAKHAAPSPRCRCGSRRFLFQNIAIVLLKCEKKVHSRERFKHAVSCATCLFAVFDINSGKHVKVSTLQLFSASTTRSSCGCSVSVCG